MWKVRGGEVEERRVVVGRKGSNRKTGRKGGKEKMGKEILFSIFPYFSY